MVTHRAEVLLYIVFCTKLLIRFPLEALNWSDWIDSEIPCVSIYVCKYFTIVFPLVNLVILINGKLENLSIATSKYFFPLCFSIGPVFSNWSSWTGCVGSRRGFDAIFDTLRLKHIWCNYGIPPRDSLSLCIWGHHILILPASLPVMGVLCEFVLVLPDNEV